MVMPSKCLKKCFSGLGAKEQGLQPDIALTPLGTLVSPRLPGHHWGSAIIEHLLEDHGPPLSYPLACLCPDHESALLDFSGPLFTGKSWAVVATPVRLRPLPA